MFEINYSQLMQCEILDKLVTYILLTIPNHLLASCNQNLTEETSKRLNLKIGTSFVKSFPLKMDSFKITKISTNLGKKRAVLSLDSHDKSEENQKCVTTEMPVTTLGIPKKKYSRINQESSVKNYERCELETNSPSPVYDKEGKNIGLLLHYSKKVNSPNNQTTN